MNNYKLFVTDGILESQSAILNFKVVDWLFKFSCIGKKAAKANRQVFAGRLLVTSLI